VPDPRVPWSVIPIGLHAIGIGINFPTLTLLLLDRLPQYRGAVASLQAFISLVISAVIAGWLSPLLSTSSMWLALGALTSTALGFGAWGLYRRIVRGEGHAAHAGP
jgi:DHA1 family bicyclomycin/chloramphenicol resistance-like MFS transporter